MVLRFLCNDVVANFDTLALVYAGAAEVLPIVDSDLKKIAARVLENAKQLCIKKSVVSISFHLFHKLFDLILIIIYLFIFKT